MDALPDHLEIDLRKLVMTIANTVDLVGVDDVMHGRRVGMLAAEIARQQGWVERTRVMLYDAGLLPRNSGRQGNGAAGHPRHPARKGSDRASGCFGGGNRCGRPGNLPPLGSPPAQMPAWSAQEVV